MCFRGPNYWDYFYRDLFGNVVTSHFNKLVQEINLKTISNSYLQNVENMSWPSLLLQWVFLIRMSKCWSSLFYNTSDTSVTGVENFDFENVTNESIFKHHYISYMANGRLQGKEQFHSKNYLLEMPRSHAKMCFKSAPQKLNLVMAKAIPKSYTRDCSCKYSCTFPHSYA